jgi:hypothetical protein
MLCSRDDFLVRRIIHHLTQPILQIAVFLIKKIKQSPPRNIFMQKLFNHIGSAHCLVFYKIQLATYFALNRAT